ncbi:MAG: DUF302 domain-containing protein [Bacteroidia bacterium]|nr:DUF302 domain-containing protein [Bacteroidia bacterium]
METNQMIIEKVSPWDFEKTVELLKGAAEQREWNIPAIHDLQQSLAKSGKEVKPAKVIEICKPEYSGKMLEKNHERISSILMPCRISVYMKEDGKTYIAMINGTALAAGLPETVCDVMTAASNEVNEIVDSVIS